MYTLHYFPRIGNSEIKTFDCHSDLRKYVIENIKDYLLHDEYVVHIELDFNRVQVWYKDCEVFEYRWFLND